MLSQPPKTRKRKPKGKAQGYTPEQLDRMAEVSPDDIQTARAWAESNAPGLAALLNAKLDDDGSESQPAQ